ncbi:hypothetical protein V6N11_051218 [Hibiscus sabdariffa]|uniref:RNase H type-1 domain-containing protein n=1 Tax=Hibiscus sabdariffa TaxID=183260 RepID=A0ABR2N8T2_9ROSI
MGCFPPVTPALMHSLKAIPNDEEIYAALLDMASLKAPDTCYWRWDRQFLVGSAYEKLMANRWNIPHPFWKKTPPIGWTFLHTDGAVNVGSGIGAIGGLFHDYVGSWISGFGRSISISDVLTVELWVIHDSLELAWNNGFLNL